MALYKLGRSFWSPINIQNKVFSQAVGPIELKFHVKTPYGKFAIYYTQFWSNMTKVTATSIYSYPEPDG